VGGVPRFERYRVVSCHGVTFTGLAFDASTATRLYSCHGFVVRNCICDVVPILRESADTEE
jgi:hypothetical protein